MRAIEFVRERSIAAHAVTENVPDLSDPERIALGAEHYSAMCVGCHLAPGVEASELRTGLYPMPPDLSAHGGHRTPSESFWIVKHGIKMTAMPAWGKTHDDESIWGLVAFLQKLPSLDAATYGQLVGKSEAEDGHGHEHGEGEAASSSTAGAGADGGPESGAEPAHEHTHEGAADHDH
ncbi:MAG: cytochrome c [Reyranella sp.]